MTREPLAPIGRHRDPRGFRALRHRAYRNFTGGQFVSLIGTYSHEVTQAWLVLDLTGSPLMVGVVVAAQWAPVLGLGLFGGLVADALPKRRVLIAANSAAMCASLLLGVLCIMDRVEVWHVVVIATALGLCKAIESPARQSILVELVGEDDLIGAVALNSAALNLARVLGPTFAGITIASIGVSLSFVLNALSYLAVLAALGTMPESSTPRGRRGLPSWSAMHVRRDVAAGLSFVRRTPTVRLALLVLGLASTFGMNLAVMVPSIADEVLEVGPSGLGFLMATYGLGSLACSVTLAFMLRPAPVLIGGGALLLGTAEAALGISRSLPLSLLATFVLGVGAMAMGITANGVIQIATPAPLRGRVMSLYLMVFAGSLPVGGIMFGALASSAGTATTAVAAGLACAAVGAVALALGSNQQQPGPGVRVISRGRN